MTKDITPKLMQYYSKSNKLGLIKSKIPIKPGKDGLGTLMGDVKLDLSKLYGIIKTDHKNIDEASIMAVCVFGNVLYKHFNSPYSEMPHDLDLMFILTHSDNKDIVIPDKVVKPKIRKECIGYGGYEKIIESSAVYTTTPTKIYRTFLDYFFSIPKYEPVDGAIPLHVSYRSVNQFINGLGRGDTVSESVVEYGIPIIGQERFAEIIKDVKSPERKPLHGFAWHVDLEGRLQGEIL